jgi:serine/threonine-protein kinase
VALVEGQVISDRYRLIRLLGKGGMGSVWLAEHTTLKNEIAIKLIDSELGTMPQMRARFLREAQLAARIKSAHVVQVHDYGVSGDGQPYIAMEYLVGMSLRERLEKRGRLTGLETARVVSHVCRALSRAHETGLVHRDLKPENIFIAQEGEDELVKVLDFGVAKAADALSDSGIDPTRTGALLGTPFYMSPEQAQGLKTVDHRTDLWAMGVVVFECLTGGRPFAAAALGPLIRKILVDPIPAPSSLAPEATREIDAWMTRALARDPAGRFASARELSEAFMIATGATDSLGRDRSVSAVRSAPPARPSGSALPDTPAVVDSTLALGATMPLASDTVPFSSPPSKPQAAPRSRSWLLGLVVLGALAAGAGVVFALWH